jgi:hypothetical protein
MDPHRCSAEKELRSKGLFSNFSSDWVADFGRDYRRNSAFGDWQRWLE